MTGRKIEITSRYNPHCPREFVVRLVTEGEQRMSTSDAIYTGDPIVQFYACNDANKSGEDLGFLVSSYYLETLLDRRDGPNAGIDLHSGMKDYIIDQSAFAEVYTQMQKWDEELKAEQSPSMKP